MTIFLNLNLYTYVGDCMEKVRFKRKKFKFLKRLTLLAIFFSLVYFIGSKIKLSSGHIKFLTDTYIDTSSTTNPDFDTSKPVVNVL